MAPIPYEEGNPSSGIASTQSNPVINFIPCELKVSKPLLTRKNAINPRITSEDKPPAVTIPRKILSEVLGVVVMTLGGGVGLQGRVSVLTRA
jgi:hypothetical protein